jgi:hypothetical protein
MMIDDSLNIRSHLSGGPLINSSLPHILAAPCFQLCSIYTTRLQRHLQTVNGSRSRPGL